jgi:hypothetical protein
MNFEPLRRHCQLTDTTKLTLDCLTIEVIRSYQEAISDIRVRG